jgi:hypothetical protein
VQSFEQNLRCLPTSAFPHSQHIRGTGSCLSPPCTGIGRRPRAGPLNAGSGVGGSNLRCFPNSFGGIICCCQPTLKTRPACCLTTECYPRSRVVAPRTDQPSVAFAPAATSIPTGSRRNLALQDGSGLPVRQQWRTALPYPRPVLQHDITLAFGSC